MIDLLIRFRYITFASALIAVAILAAAGKHVRYEQSLASFFADDDPTVVAYRRAGDAFGSDQFVFVAYDDAELFSTAGIGRVRELAKQLSPEQLTGVVRVESLDQMPLPWKIDEQLVTLSKLPAPLRAASIAVLKQAIRGGVLRGDALSVDAVFRTASERERARLGRRISAHPLFRGTLVSESGTTTALVVRLTAAEEHDVQHTIAAIRERSDSFAAKHRLGRVAVVGPPVLLADGFAAIEEDGRRLAIAGLALIAIVTFAATRSVWWAMVPILAAWTVWLGAETLFASFNLRLSLSSGPLVAQIIVLTMPTASHLALHFRDELARGVDRELAARATLKSVARPVLWCAVAGTIGYAALLSSNVVPIRQFGLILAGCTAIASLLTFALVPFAMLAPGHAVFIRRFGARMKDTRPWLLDRVTRYAVDHPAPIVAGTLAVVVPISSGIFRLQYESNYIKSFDAHSRVVRDYQFVESRLGGIGVVYLVATNVAKMHLGTLRDFDGLDSSLRSLADAHGAATFNQVISLATLLDSDGLLAQAASPGFDPVGTKLDLIAASPQGDLLDSFWNREKGLVRVLLRLSEQQSADQKDAAFRSALTAARRALPGETFLTGLSHLLTQTTRGVIQAQWSTVAWSIGGILLALTLAFRDPILAALALLPSLIAVGLSLGLMGWLGISLDLATALVGSVALGLSVDDTFHCLLEFQHRRADSLRERLLASYSVTGPGVLLSSFAVAAGFLVLRASPFVPFVNFGSMVGVATLGSSIGNVILLPAFLSLAHQVSRARPSLRDRSKA